MSNIHDALTKHRQEMDRSRGAGALPGAAGASRRGTIPVALEPGRDRELEELRQRVILELGAGRSAVIVFTAAVPGEGASTLSLLFAYRLAEAESRPVLLVDGDLAHTGRSLSSVLGNGGEARGLVEILTGSHALKDVVVPTEEPNLHFLPCGSVAGPNIDLVREDRLSPLLEEMRRVYSFVVVDSASTLAAPETGPLAAAADGVVMVVRAGRSRRETVQKALHLLGKARCRLLGVVLNDRRYPIPSFIYRRI